MLDHVGQSQHAVHRGHSAAFFFNAANGTTQHLKQCLDVLRAIECACDNDRLTVDKRAPRHGSAFDSRGDRLAVDRSQAIRQEGIIGIGFDVHMHNLGLRIWS